MKIKTLRDLSLGGSFNMSDYSNFICDDGVESLNHAEIENV